MQFGRVLLTASLALILGASSGLAGEMDFTIITSESSLTITLLDTTTTISSGQITKGVVTGSTATTQFQGTLGATIAGGTITFGGDTTLAAMNQASTSATNPLLSLKPGVGGTGSSGPADVGLGATLHVDYKGTNTTAIGPLALRNLLSFIISPSIPVTGGSFAAGTTGLGISAGEADYSLSAGITSVSGSYGITSGALTNGSTKDGTIVVSGLTTTITLPISLFLSSLITTLGANVSIEFTGQLVAQFISSAVPEPGTFTLLGIGTLGLLGWARQRRRSGTK
jgi:hypothetical protein